MSAWIAACEMLLSCGRYEVRSASRPARASLAMLSFGAMYRSGTPLLAADVSNLVNRLLNGMSTRVTCSPELAAWTFPRICLNAVISAFPDAP